MTAWAAHPADTAEVWPDAETMTPATVERFLVAAQEECEVYAPTLAAGAPVPARYTLAVVMQARDIWNASRRSPDGTLGPEEYAVTPRPLSADVKQRLRPRSPRPRFGRPAVTP